MSKYLKRVLAAGIVRITVETDSNEELESAFERRFGLREAYVVVRSIDLEQIADFWARLDIGIVGIGASVKSSNLVWMGSFGHEAIERLMRERVVGEICSMFYDIEGHPVHTEFQDRIIVAGLDRLRALDYSIGMAACARRCPQSSGRCADISSTSSSQMRRRRRFC